MTGRSELDRYRLYFEAPKRGEETARTIEQLTRSIRKGLQRIMPLMPYFGKRGKK